MSVLAVSPELYGARPNDEIDDTEALQATIDNHAEVELNGEYRISSTLRLRSNLRISSNGSGGLSMSSGAPGFGNLNPAREYADNAVALLAENVSNLELRNFRIHKQFEDRSSVSAVRVRGGSNIHISGLDITGFSNGLVIALDSVAWGSVSSNLIHGSYTSSDAQHTAIAIDSSRLVENGSVLNSSALVVDNNFIMSLKVSPQLLAQNRVETDGINIAGPEAHDIWLLNNAIAQVGEGIDSFGQRINVRNNRIYENYIFGIKLVHGASNSLVDSNNIIRPAKVGIVLAGSNTVDRNTTLNRVLNNAISGVGQHSDINWRPQFTAGISLEPNGGQTGSVVGNVIDQNQISNTTQMDYGVLCDVPFENQISNLDLQGQALREGLRDCI